MKILNAFEELSLTPFYCDETKKTFIENLPNKASRANFLNNDQLNLRENLFSSELKQFADAIDVVSF